MVLLHFFLVWHVFRQNIYKAGFCGILRLFFRFFDFLYSHGRSLLSNYQFSILPNILIAFCGTHGFIFLVIFDCILI